MVDFFSYLGNQRDIGAVCLIAEYSENHRRCMSDFRIFRESIGNQKTWAIQNIQKISNRDKSKDLKYY